VALWVAARERRYQLLISPAIVTEVAEKLRHKFGWEEAAGSAAVETPGEDWEGNDCPPLRARCHPGRPGR